MHKGKPQELFGDSWLMFVFSHLRKTGSKFRHCILLRLFLILINIQTINDRIYVPSRL